MAKPVVSFLSSAESPWSNPTAWDTLVLKPGSKPSNWYGKFDIMGAKRSYKWDVQDGLGLQGAVELYRGRTPPPFSIKFYLWADEQYASFLQFLSSFLYDPTKLNVQPVTIYHPKLTNLGIDQVICESVGAIDKESDDLMFSCTVDLREFFPPIAFPTQSPDSAADAEESPFLTPENKALLTQIGSLSGQSNDLIGGLLGNQVRNSGSPGGLPK